MDDEAREPEGTLPLDVEERIDRVCTRFEAAWQQVAEFLRKEASPEARAELAKHVGALEAHYRDCWGKTPEDESGNDRIAPSDQAHQGTQPWGPLPSEATVTPTMSLAVRLPGFDVLDELGRGGMGVVYKARQHKPDRIVAVKVTRTDRLDGLPPGKRRKVIERFLTEAQAAAQVEHGNIVKVYQVGESEPVSSFGLDPEADKEPTRVDRETATPFYAMRYVEGSSLADLIEKGPLDPRRAAACIEQIARGLHEAHRHGILHRDVKPHNILIEAATNCPMLADFGLAKLTEADEGRTETGDVIGTPPYMAPEQAQNSARVTVASDIYSLGATLYAALTGRPPFQGATPVETLRQICERSPTPLRKLRPSVPKDLETICHKCLEKETGKRYASAAELAERLRMFLENRPIPDRPVSSTEKLWRWCRRKPLLASLAGAICGLALVIVIGGPIAIWLLDKERCRAVAAESDAQKHGRRARSFAYDARFREAHAHFLNGDFISCRLALDECDPDLCGPEHGFLTGQLNRSLRPICKSAYDFFLSTDGKRLTIHTLHNINVFELESDKATLVLTIPRPVGWSYMTGRCLFTVARDGSRITMQDMEADPRIEVPFGEFKQPVSVGALPPAVAISPDGKCLCSGHRSGEIRVWDVENRKERFVLQGHCGPVDILAFSPDGKQLFSCGLAFSLRPEKHNSYEIKAWNLETREEVFALRGYSGAVSSMAISSDGTRLASFGGDVEATIKIWDLATRKEVRTLPGGRCIAMTRDGKRLFTNSNSRSRPMEFPLTGYITEWDVDKGIQVRTIRGHVSDVSRLAISPDGKQLFSSSIYGSEVNIWNFAPTEELVLGGHKGSVFGLAISSDGGRLWSGSVEFDKPHAPLLGGLHGGVLKEWDLRMGRETRELSGGGPYGRLVVTKDSRRLYAGGSFLGEGDSEIKVVDLEKWEHLPNLQGHADMISSLLLSHDGNRLFSASRSIKMWDLEKNLALHTFGKAKEDDLVTSLALSADEKRLFACSYQGNITVWNVAQAKEYLVLKNPGKDSALNVAISPDGNRLVSTTFQVEGVSEILIWDVGRRTFSPMARERGIITSIAISPDGKRLFSGSQKTIKIWNLETEKMLLTLRLPEPVWSLALSPDGTRLFAGVGSEVRVWDLGAPGR